MIGPVSGTGRAMMASLQQAIQKGMPPDQAIQYVKSMATQGVAPLTDLYAMMNQFQRLKQQPVQAPQTPPTIRDQLNMAEQQQAQQQMAMQQGLGGLPAPAMEEAQFAGGGIVAFDEGGDVNSSIRDFFIKQKAIEFVKKGQAKEAVSLLRSEGIDPHEVLGDRINILAPAPARTPVDERTRDFNLPANFGLEGASFDESVVKPEPFGITLPSSGNVAASAASPSASRTDTASRVPAAPRVAAAPTAAAPAQLTREEMEDQEYERIQAFRKREGLGSASEKLQQFLTDEGSKLDKQFGEDRMLAFAEAGFKMAAAASRPGATFLGAFSEGAISGTQALRGLQKEMNANRRSLKESMLKLEEAKELRKEGDFKTAMQQTQQARAEMFEIKKHADAMAMDERKLQAVIEGNRLQYAAATARGQPGALGADDVARNQLGVLNDRAAAARKIMSDYQMLMTPPTPEQKRAYAEAQREYADAERLRSQLTGLPYSGGPAANTSAPPSDITALINHYTGQGR